MRLLVISAVLVGMMLGGFSCVMGSVLSVPMCHMGVMTGFLVISTFVLLGSFTMVFRGEFVVFRRLEVVLCPFVFHFDYLSMSSRRAFRASPAPEYTTLGVSVRLIAG